MVAGTRSTDLPLVTSAAEFVVNDASGAGRQTAANAATQISALINAGTGVLGVKSRVVATPPGSPSVGDRYIIATSPTGAWSGKATQIATWNGSAWTFIVPTDGYTVLVLDEFVMYGFKTADSLWHAITASTLAFDTKAHLLAVTTAPANAKAEVFADANPAFNGTYASDGAGGWTYISALAFALKADIASPTLTGTPAAPTAPAGANTTQIATTAFVQDEFSARPVAITLGDAEHVFSVDDSGGESYVRLKRDNVADWSAGYDASKVYLYSRRFGRAVTVPLAGSGTPTGAEVHGSKFQYLLNNTGTLTPYGDWAEAEHRAPLSTTRLYFLPATGQSLGMGDKATPIISTPSTLARSRALTFDFGTVPHDKYMTLTWVSESIADKFCRRLVPAFERKIGAAGETPFSAMVKALAAVGTIPSTTAMATASVAVGSASYTYLAQGTQTYKNLLRLVRRATMIARMNGWTCVVPAVPFKGGESDSSTSQSAYLGYLTTLQSNLDTDIKAITGQSETVILLMTQPTSWGAFGVTDGTVARAMEQAATTYPSLFLNAGPDYSFAHATDDVHFTNAGSYHCGELMAKCLADKLNGGSGGTLRPTSATLVGTTVTVDFSVPVSPIVLDTVTWTNAGNMGIRWKDNGDGNAPTITNVATASATSLAVTLSVAPTGTGKKLGFGDLGVNGVGSNIGVGPRTNIRDSSTAVSVYDAAHLYNWCVVTDIAVV